MVSPPDKHFLYFSKKERAAICFLLLLIIIFSFGVDIYLYFKPARPELFSHPDLELLQVAGINQQRTFTQKDEVKQEVRLFYFDPNKTTDEEWMRLGVSEKTAAGISKYISKGGNFREPGEIKKIWGISEEKASELIPFIRIAKENQARPLYSSKDKQKTKPVEINLADSSDFEKLPGIGPKLSQRIINFRTRLGGFYKVEQVGETYGLPDSTFQKLKPLLFIKETTVQKLNINTATFDEIRRHPYVKYQIAKTIIAYRDMHGPYEDLLALKDLILINDEIFQKLVPYLSVE